jgi:hypothetical protein
LIKARDQRAYEWDAQELFADRVNPWICPWAEQEPDDSERTSDQMVNWEQSDCDKQSERDEIVLGD